MHTVCERAATRILFEVRCSNFLSTKMRSWYVLVRWKQWPEKTDLICIWNGKILICWRETRATGLTPWFLNVTRTPLWVPFIFKFKWSHCWCHLAHLFWCYLFNCFFKKTFCTEGAYLDIATPGDLISCDFSCGLNKSLSFKTGKVNFHWRWKMLALTH